MKRQKNKVILMLNRKIFILGLVVLFSNIIIAQSNNEEIIKVETALVNIPVIVSDRNGRNISGLKLQDFTVFEDGKQQKIEYFASEESPLNVAILLDTSKSTQRVLGKIKKAAREFLKQLQPTDKAMIVSFDNDLEFLSELTSDRKTLDRAIKNAEIGKSVGTVMQDALYEVVEKNLNTVKGRKAIILLTDGKDFGSYITKRDLIYRLEESDTLVYSIFYETENPRQFNPNRQNVLFPNRRRQRRQPFPFPDNFPRQNRVPNNPRQIIQQQANDDAVSFLQKIAESTAGRIYRKEVDDLDETFKSIADELRKQYLIGYYPEVSTNITKSHQVKVKVDLNNVVVRAKTYYRKKD